MLAVTKELTPTKQERAKRMYKMYLLDPSVEEVAKAYNVSTATVYSDFKAMGYELITRARGQHQGTRVIRQNTNGEWAPAIPLPINYKLIAWMGGGKYGCPECVEKFFRIDSYEKHYRTTHA